MTTEKGDSNSVAFCLAISNKKVILGWTQFRRFNSSDFHAFFQAVLNKLEKDHPGVSFCFTGDNEGIYREGLDLLTTDKYKHHKYVPNPRYAPFLNPIEYVFNQLKLHMNGQQLKTPGDTLRSLQASMKTIQPENLDNYYKTAKAFLYKCLQSEDIHSWRIKIDEKTPCPNSVDQKWDIKHKMVYSTEKLCMNKGICRGTVDHPIKPSKQIIIVNGNKKSLFEEENEESISKKDDVLMDQIETNNNINNINTTTTSTTTQLTNNSLSFTNSNLNNNKHHNILNSIKGVNHKELFQSRLKANLENQKAMRRNAIQFQREHSLSLFNQQQTPPPPTTTTNITTNLISQLLDKLTHHKNTLLSNLKIDEQEADDDYRINFTIPDDMMKDLTKYFNEGLLNDKYQVIRRSTPSEEFSNCHLSVFENDEVYKLIDFNTESIVVLYQDGYNYNNIKIGVVFNHCVSPFDSTNDQLDD